MRRTLPLSLTAAAMAVVAIPGASAVEAPSAVRWGDCPKDAALPGLECSTLKVPLDQQNERDPGTPLVAARKLRQAFGELARWSRPTRAARRLPVRQERVRERRGDQLPDHGRAALARPRLRGGDPLITSPGRVPPTAPLPAPTHGIRRRRGETGWSVGRGGQCAAAVRVPLPSGRGTPSIRRPAPWTRRRNPETPPRTPTRHGAATASRGGVHGSAFLCTSASAHVRSVSA